MTDRFAVATTPTDATEAEGPLTEVLVRGEIPAEAVDYARKRLGTVLDHITEPIRFVRLKLTLAPDPAREQPALAQVTLDLDGDVVRTHVAAHEVHAAADLLQQRLRHQLEQRSSHRLARRRRGALTESGEWRHGDAATLRPEYFDRPRPERELVRRKTFTLAEATPDEAAYDMDQLDFDFHLYRDLASGEDALIERLAGGTYRLTRLHPLDVDPGPTAITLTVADAAPPVATAAQAIERLDLTGDPFVFFADAKTKRGNVVYRRYDGHYGLITPE